MPGDPGPPHPVDKLLEIGRGTRTIAITVVPAVSGEGSPSLYAGGRPITVAVGRTRASQTGRTLQHAVSAAILHVAQAALAVLARRMPIVRLGAGSVASVGLRKRFRLPRLQRPEAGLDRPENALLDHLRREAVERPLERIACVHPLAEDPGLAILPVHVVAEEHLVHPMYVLLLAEHDVAGEVKGEPVLVQRAAPAAHPVVAFEQQRLRAEVVRGAEARGARAHYHRRPLALPPPGTGGDR